jgi:hypothetical protein
MTPSTINNHIIITWSLIGCSPNFLCYLPGPVRSDGEDAFRSSLQYRSTTSFLPGVPSVTKGACEHIANRDSALLALPKYSCWRIPISLSLLPLSMPLKSLSSAVLRLGYAKLPRWLPALPGIDGNVWTLGIDTPSSSSDICSWLRYFCSGNIFLW